MKYFGIYTGRGTIKNIEYLGNFADQVHRGGVIKEMAQAVHAGRQHLDAVEHENFIVVKIDELRRLDEVIKRAVFLSNTR